MTIVTEAKSFTSNETFEWFKEKICFHSSQSKKLHRYRHYERVPDLLADVIDTELKVKESKSVLTDSIITAKVKGKIRHLYIYNKLAPDYDLHVETTNQVVHIFGSVNRAIDVDTIVAAAKEVKGVKSVRTSIKHP